MEMPREPKFYPNELPQTGCNIPMPTVKQPKRNGDKICDTCVKEDVCMYKNECIKAENDIAEIRKRTNVFIQTDTICAFWSEKDIRTR